MRTPRAFFIALVPLVWLASCDASDSRGRGTSGQGGDGDGGADGDAGADGDTDADGDADGGADGDTDTDTDADADGDGDADGDADGCTGMEILFVIDDSASMGEEQQNLKDNFPGFVNVLDAYTTSAGTPLQYKIGVTTIGILRTYKENGVDMTSAFGGMDLDDGQLLGQDTPPEPNCGLADPWLEGPGPGVIDTFDCMASVGLTGTVVEMPLGVIQEALGPRLAPGGTNEGFYTPGGDSLLVVVIITDEDDCSIEEGGQMKVSAKGASDCSEATSIGLYPPAETKEFLDDLTGGEERYVVVTIAAVQQCQSEFGKADAAPRLKELVDLCGDNGFFGDICAGDLSTSLEEALDTMELACSDMPPVI
jgi:hypothetical protein